MLWIVIIEKENPHTKNVQFDGVGSKDGCQALQNCFAYANTLYIRKDPGVTPNPVRTPNPDLVHFRTLSITTQPID